MCGTFSTTPTSAPSCRPSRVRAISIFHVATSPEPRSAIKSFSVSSIPSSSSLSASQIRSAAFDPPFMSRIYTRSFDGSREKSLQVAFPPYIRCTFRCSSLMMCPLCNAPFFLFPTNFLTGFYVRRIQRLFVAFHPRAAPGYHGKSRPFQLHVHLQHQGVWSCRGHW
jgi:hypothetical protein